MRARACSECQRESPETHMVRGQVLCGLCLRARAQALGWDHPAVGPATERPLLEPPFELQEFESVYRARVAVRGPFCWQALDYFRQGLAGLADPARLSLVAGAPRHWAWGQVESACGLLRYRLPSAFWGVRLEFDEVCCRWPEFVNYRDLLPTGALRNYLEGVEQLLLGRLPQAMELAHRYHDSDHRNLEAILLVHFGVWDEALRIWGNFVGHAEHDENLELLKTARGYRVEKVEELYRLGQLLEVHTRRHKQSPVNLSGIKGHRCQDFDYEFWQDHFQLRIKGADYPRWVRGQGVVLSAEDEGPRLGETRVWSPLEAVAKEIGVRPRREWHEWLSMARELRGDLEGAAHLCSPLERYLLLIQGRIRKKVEVPVLGEESLSKQFPNRLKEAVRVLRQEKESRGLSHLVRLAVLLSGRGRSPRSLTPPAAWKSVEARILRARLESDWGRKRLARFPLEGEPLAQEIARLIEDGAVADAWLLMQVERFPQFQYLLYRWYDLGAPPKDPDPAYKAWVDSRGGEHSTTLVMKHLAEQAFEKALLELAARRGPVSDLLRARCAVATSNQDDALWLLRNLGREHPDWVEVHACLADCLRTLGRFEEAEQELKTAIKRRPDNVYFRHQRYRLLLEMGNVRSARRELKNLERLRPDLDHVAEYLDSFERPILGPAGVLPG